MKVTVGQYYEAGILRVSILASLFFADERIILLGLRFKDRYRETAFIQQKVINVAFCRLFEVITMISQ